MRQTNLQSPVLNQSQTREHDVAAWWNTKPRDVPNIQVRWNWKVSNDKYVWKFESNLPNINADDKPVALGLAWLGLKVKANALSPKAKAKAKD